MKRGWCLFSCTATCSFDGCGLVVSQIAANVVATMEEMKSDLILILENPTSIVVGVALKEKQYSNCKLSFIMSDAP